MDLKTIVWDSLKYPVSDWKKLLIVGIIVLFTVMTAFRSTLPIMGAAISSLGVIESIIGFLFVGYLFKIIKSSLDGGMKLPEFSPWFKMFIDGIKVWIVSIVYMIPVFLILIYLALVFPSTISATMKMVMSYPVTELTIINMITYSQIEIVALIGVLAMIMIYPLLKVAIAHMAYNDSKIGAAFNFSEIFNKIATIGWKNFLVWYIVTGILFYLIYLISIYSLGFFRLLILNYVGIDLQPLTHLLYLLIIVPYLYMYFTRAVSLFYKSE